eukprot:TRINITY_DN30612_c0_g1_i1.p1 TRINITY_DN30612_c0_g1~~TRINITY_DN30612_c0_g1_i1.p1  ORF type:complete len:271 (+),score=48.58 TRINITY_DN30612_c0_g1_i1:226-1038(+)
MTRSYTLQEQLGNGAYGVVYRAQHTQTGDTVAVKKLKGAIDTWNAVLNHPEVVTLKELSHPNVIRLREVVREGVSVYLVFEHCDSDVFHIMKKGLLSGSKARDMMWQVFSGLKYIHSKGIIHRDLKPENLLVSGDTRQTCSVVKIADFGMATRHSPEPFSTTYISTRWYRAPELLLQQCDYSFPIDIWAAATIMCEVITLEPVFPGTTTSDMLSRIAAQIGPLSHAEQRATSLNLRSKRATDVVAAILKYNPARRPTAEEVLRFSYFTEQ